MIAQNRLTRASREEAAAADDERDTLTGLISLLMIGQHETVREIVATLNTSMFTSCAADLFPAIVDALAKPVEVVGIQDVLIALRAAGHRTGDAVNLFADAIDDKRAVPAYLAERMGREGAEQIRGHHSRRQAVTAAEAVVDAGGDPESVARLLELAAAPVDRPKGITGIDALDQWSRHERTPKVPTGFGWLDDPTDGGLPQAGITALVAGPGIGKSAAALQWVCGALIHDLELRAVWGLGEMTPAGLARRMLCVASGLLEGCPTVTMDMAGHRTKEARAASARIAEAIGGRLHIVPAPLTVAAIDAAVCTTGAKLVVIDYAQLVHIPGGGKDRVADLDRLAGEIRDMAIARECAVILPSSMAKAAGNAVNAGQAARGSAEIGFAAELVYVGAREETPDGRPIVGPDGCHGITWRCAKARNCEPRDLVTRFDGSTQTFHDAEPIEEFPEFRHGAFTGNPR